MTYAINRRTKEHRLTMFPGFFELPDDDWDIVQATPDGWIEWQGGECPLPDGSEHEVRFDDGKVVADDDPDSWAWHIDGNARPITAYRPILDADAKPRQATMSGQALWQDAEGTIPCREGDPVGRVDCGVTGNAWTSSGDGRPVYREPPHPEQGTRSDTPPRPFLDSGRLRERFGPFPVGPPAWDGDGLPPVGCECECKRYPSGREWVDCKVVSHDLEDGLYVAVARVGSEYLGLPMANFRPIRSEEDRAVDQLMVDAELMRVQAERVYRAGYRKTAAADGEEV